MNSPCIVGGGVGKREQYECCGGQVRTRVAFERSMACREVKREEKALPCRRAAGPEGKVGGRAGG